jgi:hypothetical protein
MKLYHLSRAFFIFSAGLLDIVSNFRFRIMYVVLLSSTFSPCAELPIARLVHQQVELFSHLVKAQDLG